MVEIEKIGHCDNILNHNPKEKHKQLLFSQYIRCLSIENKQAMTLRWWVSILTILSLQYF